MQEVFGKNRERRPRRAGGRPASPIRILFQYQCSRRRRTFIRRLLQQIRKRRDIRPAEAMGKPSDESTALSRCSGDPPPTLFGWSGHPPQDQAEPASDRAEGPVL